MLFLYLEFGWRVNQVKQLKYMYVYIMFLYNFYCEIVGCTFMYFDTRTHTIFINIHVHNVSR